MHSTMLTFYAVTSDRGGGRVSGEVVEGGRAMCCSPAFSRTVIGVNGGEVGGIFFMHFLLLLSFTPKMVWVGARIRIFVLEACRGHMVRM